MLVGTVPARRTRATSAPSCAGPFCREGGVDDQFSFADPFKQIYQVEGSSTRLRRSEHRRPAKRGMDPARQKLVGVDCKKELVGDEYQATRR